jgi:hypothetical protein
MFAVAHLPVASVAIALQASAEFSGKNSARCRFHYIREAEK